MISKWSASLVLIKISSCFRGVAALWARQMQKHHEGSFDPFVESGVTMHNCLLRPWKAAVGFIFAVGLLAAFPKAASATYLSQSFSLDHSNTFAAVTNYATVLVETNDGGAAVNGLSAGQARL